MNFLQYGLQRSGTNFLKSIVVKNFKDIHFVNREERALPTHKHFRLYDEKQFVPEQKYHNELHFETFQDYEQAVREETGIQDLRYIVTVKNPYAWYLSITKNARNLNWPSFVYGKEFQDHFIHDFNYFYRKWIDFAKEAPDRIFIHTYEDLLNETDATLRRLQQQFQLKRKKDFRYLFWGKKDQFFNVKRVPNSRHWNEERRQFYVNKTYYDALKPVEKEGIDALLDSTLLRDLGFKGE